MVRRSVAGDAGHKAEACCHTLWSCLVLPI